MTGRKNSREKYHKWCFNHARFTDAGRDNASHFVDMYWSRLATVMCTQQLCIVFSRRSGQHESWAAWTLNMADANSMRAISTRGETCWPSRERWQWKPACAHNAHEKCLSINLSTPESFLYSLSVDGFEPTRAIRLEDEGARRHSNEDNFSTKYPGIKCFHVESVSRESHVAPKKSKHEHVISEWISWSSTSSHTVPK